MMKKEIQFDWNEKCQKSFDKLLQAIAKNIALYIPDPKGAYSLFVDSSSYAWGGVLKQIGPDGLEHVVSCASGTWSPQEQKQPILLLEALALLNSLNANKFYLQHAEQRITAFTDSRALTFLKKASPLNDRFYRIILEILTWDINICHVSGKRNNFADVISRKTPRATEKIGIKLPREQLDTLVRMINVDHLTLIPKENIKQLLDLDKFTSDETRPIKEIKKDYQDFLDEIQKIIEQQVIEENTIISSQQIHELFIESPDEREFMIQVITLEDEPSQEGTAAQADEQPETSTSQASTSQENQKRPRGRPRKHPIPQTIEQQAEAEIFQQHEEPELIHGNEEEEEEEREDEEETNYPLFDLTYDTQRDLLTVIALQEGSISVPNFQKVQKQDAFCQNVIEKLDQHDEQHVNEFTFKRGLLLKKGDSPMEDEKRPLRYYRIVLPKVLIMPVVQSLHCQNSPFHLPAKRVLATLMAKYWAPRLRKEAESILRSCRTCQITKPSTAPQAPIGIPHSVTFPKIAIALDVLCNMPTTDKGHNHILVMVDLATRYVVMAPIRNQTSAEILNAFMTSWTAALGIPTVVRTDGHKSFVGGEFAQYLRQFNIVHNIASPHHPQANGSVEAMNKIIKQQIRAYVTHTNQPTKWDMVLPLLASALNSLVSDRLGASPHFLMFRHETINPFSDFLMLQVNLQKLNLTKEEYQAQTAELMTMVDELRAAIRTTDMASRNNHRMPPNILPGMLIMQKVPKLESAQQNSVTRPIYTGPYMVTHVLQSVVYATHVIKGTKIRVHKDTVRILHSSIMDYVMPNGFGEQVDNLVYEINPSQRPERTIQTRSSSSQETSESILQRREDISDTPRIDLDTK